MITESAHISALPVRDGLTLLFVIDVFALMWVGAKPAKGAYLLILAPLVAFGRAAYRRPASPLPVMKDARPDRQRAENSVMSAFA